MSDDGATADLQSWLDDVSTYDREYKKWETRVEKILKRYRDENRRSSEGTAKFNILWANVQTLVPATFSQLPQPDVARRFRDNDPVGRVASLLLERALDFEIQHYRDYRATMKSSVYDRFLGGRATAWVRYEPHIRQIPNEPEDGVEVTEDIDEPNEELEYECAPVDYVHWKDFGHSVARTWEEVTRVWRKVYMTMPAKIERFGKELAAKIPHDSKPKDATSRYNSSESDDKGSWVYEGWDKETKEAVWFHKGMKEFLDQRPDPLELEEFFPCPQPLYATITNDSLVPIPDFSLYQDQAEELDTLSDRIYGLTKALQVKGVYDASVPALRRLFTEGGNGDLLPVENWMAFAEKNGLAGALDVVDLMPIAKALNEAYAAMDQIKSQIYEITGIADIIRGQGQASETATATQIKGQYASLRLRSMQEDVSRYATELLRLKAQVMCKKFQPETLAQISAANQLSPADQQLIPQALQLLAGGNPLRSFRIEVAADTLVRIDEESEKQNRVEFLTAVGGYLEKAVQAGGAAPQLTPLLMELLKFGVTGFKIGKTIEGAFDQALDQLKQAAANPQQKPDPEMVKVQAQQQSDKARLQAEQSHKQMDMQLEAQRLQQEAALKQRDQDLAHQRELEKMSREESFQRWKAELEARTQIEVAEISKQTTLATAQISSAQEAINNAAL